MGDQEPRQRSTTFFLENRLLWAGLLAVVFLAGSAMLAGFHNPQTIAATIMRDVGLTLIIAIAIGLSIEAASRRELETTVNGQLLKHGNKLQTMIETLEETVNTCSAALFQRFPKDVRSEIETSILRSDFIRSDYTAHYTLSLVNAHDLDAAATDASNVVKVSVKTQYRAENAAYGTRDFKINLYLDIPTLPEFRQFTRICRVTIDGENIDIASNTVKDSEAQVHFEYTKRQIPADGCVSVTSEYTFVKAKDDYETWQSNYITKNVRITLIFPPEVKDWDAIEMHRSTLEKNQAEHWGELTIPGVTLPNQGFILWWRCSEASKIPATRYGELRERTAGPAQMSP